MRRIAIAALFLQACTPAPAPAKTRFATDVTVGAAIAGGVDSLLNIGTTIKHIRAASAKTKKVVKKVAAKVAGR